METKPVKPGWYVNHVWFLRDHEIEIEKIWLCGPVEDENIARMIARERGYYGERIECIEGGKEDENRLHD